MIEEQGMAEEEPRRKRSWAKKFRDAFRGACLGVGGDRSFRVHFLAAAAVIVAATLMRVDLIEWCALVLSIALVLTAEMFNSALESLAKAITERHHPRLADALDVSSAAVLVASIGASIVGGIIFIHRLGCLAGCWQ